MRSLLYYVILTCTKFDYLGGEGGFWQYTGSSVVLWLFNLFILALGLVKVFVYGDPILDSKSKASTHFWRHNKQAEFDLSKVNLSYMFVKRLFDSDTFKSVIL